MAKRIPKYNPAFLTGDELVEAFVVRYAELETIVQVIRENVGESNQHFLVIGPRGIGKTMLVLRVAEEVRRDKDLSERWYPLVFSEESYPVTSPGEFWLEALFHLGEQTDEERWKGTYKELMKEQDEIRLRERALAQLMDFADAQGKRILLVVENFNMLVGDQISDDDAWVVRKTLLNEGRVMLLASATSRFEQIDNEEKAMFELFRRIKLERLEGDECRALWTSITGEEITNERIRPIEILTGGSPRLVRIVSRFASKMSLKELMDDLMHLVDDHTEYFKRQLDYLPATERKVYLALAEIWDPATAKEVAKAARVGVSKASSLLGRLVERGAVVPADGEGRKKRYQVAERMYNIYYLMRRRGAPSRRVKAVVNFMVSFYGEEELATMAARIAEEACDLAAEMRVDHYCAYEGILERAASSETRYKLVEITPKGFFEMPDIPSSIKRLVEPEGREKDVSEILGRAGTLREDAKTVGEAEELYRRAIEIAPQSAKAWGALGLLLHEKLERYDEAEKAYRRAIELKDGKYAWGWAHLGLLLHEKLEWYDEAEKAYRKAIELDEKSAWGWAHLGLLLHEKLERYDEAEKAYRKAIELEPKVAWGHGKLGCLLHEKLERYDEAEKAYRKAIELDEKSAWAWAHLGLLLHEKLERYDEAEKAYRKAIELDEKSVGGWAGLGLLLHEKLERYKEAEEAYRKGIELDEKYAGVWWAALGLLLDEKLGRYDDAEEAYRKALEVGPENRLVLQKLTILLLTKLERPSEAVELAQKNLAQEAEDAGMRNSFAWAFYQHGSLELLPEAEKWAHEAVELKPEDGYYRHTLASILCRLGKVQEALEQGRKYLEDTALVEKTVNEGIDLFVGLAARGVAKEALKILEESASCEVLEPLIVGLRMYLGEDVQVATEIMEIGKDVVKRIEEQRDELEAEEGSEKKSKGRKKRG